MANEIRKTSLGMQAVGVVPMVAMADARDPAAAGDTRAHVLGMSVTVGVHVAAAVLIFVMNVIEHGKPKPTEEPYQAIEAGLAIKRKSTDAKKTNLPPKEQPPVVKPPDQPGIAHNPDVVPPPPEKKPKKQPTYEEIAAAMRRKAETAQDDQEVEGADDGSEYGTLEKAKGDPYVGELIGRMTTDFEVPSVVSDTTLVTWGCVVLDENGKITKREIDPEHKSRSHAFNSAVERRLQEATDMDKPVPPHLKKLLVEKGACATYTSRRE